jgi:uncharacterized OB-fold protein
MSTGNDLVPTVFVPGEVPPADEVTAAYWEATREHRLTIQFCMACGHRQHPPRAVCTAGSSMEHLAGVDVVGTGKVDACTTVHRPPRPGAEAPYTIARVRLSEGPILLTRLVGRPSDAWAVGDPVRVDWVDLPDGRALPIFRGDDQPHPDPTAETDT